MTLRDRLEELQGSQVRIGCVEGSGFFYCGEVFNGIDDLIYRISDREENRLQKIMNKTKNKWEHRNEEFASGKNQALKTLDRNKKIEEHHVAARNRASDREVMLMLLLDSSLVKDTKLRRRFEVEKNLAHMEWFRETGYVNEARNNLDKSRENVALYENPRYKKKLFSDWEQAMLAAAENRKEFRHFERSEVVSEYPSTYEYGVRILLVKGKMEGRYWIAEEMKKDTEMQQLVKECKKGE